MALTAKDRQQLLVVLIAVALGAAVLFWMFWRAPTVERRVELEASVVDLQARVDSAKAEIARGSTEDLEERIALYEDNVRLMRRLVPTSNEVPTLIDDIASRAGLRQVRIGEIAPIAVEPGMMFETYRYRFAVIGLYDDVGEFLTDVASLPRIMVPYDVQLSLADDNARRAYGDTSSSLLEANFQLRTFVKPQAGGESGAGQ